MRKPKPKPVGAEECGSMRMNLAKPVFTEDMALLVILPRRTRTKRNRVNTLH